MIQIIIWLFFNRYLIDDKPTMAENDAIPEGTTIGNLISQLLL